MGRIERGEFGGTVIPIPKTRKSKEIQKGKWIECRAGSKIRKDFPREETALFPRSGKKNDK